MARYAGAACGPGHGFTLQLPRLPARMCGTHSSTVWYWQSKWTEPSPSSIIAHHGASPKAYAAGASRHTVAAKAAPASSSLIAVVLMVVLLHGLAPRPAGESIALARSFGELSEGLSHRAARIAAQHFAGQGAGVGCVLDHERAVDDHRGARAARELMRLGVGGAVGEIVGVEDDHIGAKTLAQQAAVLEL